MKKTLLAAALIAGFASVAQAETSVTLYGLIDTGIGYNQIKGTVNGASYKASKFGMLSGVQYGSRWGLRGAEDLGNGLRAVFTLESGFDSSTGNSGQGGRLFGRQATIGFASDSWGQLDFGSQINIATKYFYAIDPFVDGFLQSAAGNSAFSSINTARYDNMVMYQTPNFSGFQFGVGYSFNASGGQSWTSSSGLANGNTNDKNSRVITTGLRYVNGPITAALSYDNMKTHNINGTTTVGGPSTTISEWNLGGVYDFEVVKVHLAFGQTRNGWFAGNAFGPDKGLAYGELPTFTGLPGLKVNSYMVGLSAPVGNGNLFGSWVMADPRSAPDSYVGDMKKQNTFSVGYTYSLSKRTNLYAYGSYAKNVAFQQNLKSTAVGVGIRHQF